MSTHDNKRKNKSQIWFIEWIKQDKKGILLTIRPEINCPEIDSVDEVKLEDIIQSFDWDELDIWYKVEYLLK
jgi:hypothetical protein